jgi:tetratricopeptide (TPR) repeat protein
MYLGAGEAAMKRDQLAVAFPRLELAAEHAGQALALKPSHHRANLNRAEALHLLGRHAEAVKHFEAGLRILREGYGAASGRLRLFPVAMFYDHIGESLKALGQLAEAEKAFDQSLREDPFDFLTHHHYADLQLRLGRAELAAKHYQLVLRHLPPPAVTLEGPGAVPLPRRLDPGERRLLDAAQAAEQALAARFTGVKGLQQSARLRLVVFFALPPQPGFRDLHQARRLVSAAHLDTERPLAEVLALAAALLAQSGYLHDALAAAQESVRLAALQQSPTAPAMQAQRDALRAQLAPKP